MKHCYKKILIVFFFSMQFSFLKAQWVTIPDSNFVNWLNTNGYASCMNGNLMDTTCNFITNAVKVNCYYSNIQSLQGIQYFDNLDTLKCDFNDLINLPILPGGLTYLNCQGNNLTNLSQLPGTLKMLACDLNNISVLPVLPASLENLGC